MFTWLVAAAVVLCGATAPERTPPRRPDIVWIVVEDMSAHFSCYSEKTIRTPNLDRPAAEGKRNIELMKKWAARGNWCRRAVQIRARSFRMRLA